MKDKLAQAIQKAQELAELAEEINKQNDTLFNAGFVSLSLYDVVDELKYAERRCNTTKAE